MYFKPDFLSSTKKVIPKAPGHITSTTWKQMDKWATGYFHTCYRVTMLSTNNTKEHILSWRKLDTSTNSFTTNFSIAGRLSTSHSWWETVVCLYACCWVLFFHGVLGDIKQACPLLHMRPASPHTRARSPYCKVVKQHRDYLTWNETCRPRS